MFTTVVPLRKIRLWRGSEWENLPIADGAQAVLQTADGLTYWRVECSIITAASVQRYVELVYDDAPRHLDMTDADGNRARGLAFVKNVGVTSIDDKQTECRISFRGSGLLQRRQKMAKKKTATKRNPQDLTLRNLRAMKKQLKSLEKRVAALEK